MTYELSTRVVTLVGQDSLPFKEIVAIENSSVLPRGIAILDQLKSAVDFQTNEFHLNRAVDIVKSDSALAILQVFDKTISPGKVKVEQMAQILLEEVNNLIGIDLPNFTQEHLKKAVADILSNLKLQASDRWFHPIAQGQSTTYKYNLAFIVQNQETGLFFYVLPIGLTVEVDLGLQKLFSINLSDLVTYTLKLQALKIGTQIPSSINLESRS